MGRKKQKRQPLQVYGLPLVVFLTGASVLAIEVVASRILSPYFGNTIFSFSSIISVILAALSVGYYFGGRLADRRPSERLFFGIISLSGLATLLILILSRTLLPWLGSNLSVVNGPLISSCLLFFFPAVILGTLSPFAIKLQEKRTPDIGTGTIAGTMFFWSTLGSIIGSLLTGFVLIPHVRIHLIILGVGIFLVVLGIIPLLISGFALKNSRILGSLVLMAFAVILGTAPVEGYVYTRAGLYENISIYDGTYKGRPVRFLKQDRSNSGAMFLDSDELVYDYTKYYKLYELFGTDVRNALVIGGGAYSVPKALLTSEPGAMIDVSEVEPSLFGLSKKYFRLEESPNLRNHEDDGRRFLTKADKKYDLIFSDVYHSIYSVPSHFTTKEFFETAKNKLSDDGVFIANLIADSSRQNPSFLLSELKTFQVVFPNSYVFALESPASLEPQNFIVVGQKSNKQIDVHSPHVINHQDEIFRELHKKIVDPGRFELSQYPLITDDFAPTDYWIAKVLQNSLSKGTNQPVGSEMMELIAQQLRYGPRYVTAPGHQQTRDFIEAEARSFSPDVRLQNWTHTAGDNTRYNLTNIVARINPKQKRRIIIGTHYDSKRFADKDSEDKTAYVPGANDSASGVAVLLELGRVVSLKNDASVGIDLVFFDGEEGEEMLASDDTSWVPLGSSYFAKNLKQIYGNSPPDHAVVVDMVCDKDLTFKKERASYLSAPAEMQRFWDIGKSIDPSAFASEDTVGISDDHTSLMQAGIPSFLLIDYDYAPFHTKQDTLRQCSPHSLETTANTLLKYVESL